MSAVTVRQRLKKLSTYKQDAGGGAVEVPINQRAIRILFEIATSAEELLKAQDEIARQFFISRATPESEEERDKLSEAYDEARRREASARGTLLDDLRCLDVPA